MNIQPSVAPDRETGPQSLAKVISLPGVDLVVEQHEADEDVHVHDITCSPLWALYGRRQGWSGEIVTDPEEIAAIRRRVEAGVARGARRNAWRRTLRRIRAGA